MKHQKKKSTARSSERRRKTTTRRSKAGTGQPALATPAAVTHRVPETQAPEPETPETASGFQAGGSQRLTDLEEAAPETVRGFPDEGEGEEAEDTEAGLAKSIERFQDSDLNLESNESEEGPSIPTRKRAKA